MRLRFRGVNAADAPAPVSASVDADTVRQRFNWDWATTQTDFTEVDTYWWWAVSVRVDPNEVWAEDEEGNLWVVPFSTDGADQVTFGTPQRSRLTAVPVAAADGVAATAVVTRRSQRVLASNLDRPEKPGRNPAAASAGPDNERTPMDETVRQALARQHGLDPETATEEQVNAAVIAASEAETPETPDQPETPETPAAEAETPAPEAEVETPAAPEPVAAAANDRVVTVDRAQWEATQAAAEQGREARETQLAAERDQLVAAAVTDGRIAPSARQAWRDALDARPEVEASALAALTAGRIPVDERGTSTETTARDAGYDRVAASMGVRRTTPKEA